MQFIAMLMDEVERTQATFAKQQEHYIFATKLLLPREVSWRLHHICGKYQISERYKFRKKAKISYNLEHGAASNRALFSQETIFFAIFQEYNFGDMVSGTSQSTLG